MKNKILYVLTVIMCVIIGVSGTLFYQNEINKKNNDNTTNTSYSETNSLSGSINKIYDATLMVENYNGNILASSGTGFVYKKNDDVAYAMTNAHVVKGATSVKVITSNGKILDSKVVGSDEYADIAVLSLNPTEISAVASMGSSSDLNLGDTLFTVGSPLGLEYQGTVTKGILSGKNRTVTVTLSNGDLVIEVLQTDAAINEGNSGGPLCNVNGEVIGINSMKIVEESTEGMGFAIPIELAISTAEKLESGVEIVRPVIGVSLIDIDNYELYKYGITLNPNITSGSVVVQVKDGSLAAKAGIKKGDVITAIDGNKVKDTAYFRYLLYKHDIGDTIKITFNRDAEQIEKEIKLSESLEG